MDFKLVLLCIVGFGIGWHMGDHLAGDYIYDTEKAYPKVEIRESDGKWQIEADKQLENGTWR